MTIRHIAALCVILALLGAPVIATAQDAGSEKKAPAYTDLNDQISYALGIKVGNSVYTDVYELNMDVFVEGLKDVFEGREPRMSQSEMFEAINVVSQRLQERAKAEKAKRDKEMEKRGAEALMGGAKYLEENGAKPGVVTTDSGLQYRVIEPGDGEPATQNDTVWIDYTGRFIDGGEFDSSKGRQPIRLSPPWKVIPGWIEAVQLMPKGAKYEVTIPAQLAYGDAGRGPIPPNSVLIFDMEVTDIKRGEPQVTIQPQTP